MMVKRANDSGSSREKLSVRSQPIEDTDMDTDDSLDIRNLKVPLVTIVAIIGFFIWATWFGAGERGRLDNKIETLSQNVTTLADSVAKLNDYVHNSERNLRTDTWSHSAHIIWCLKAQILNTNWKCPEAEELQLRPTP
jgi:hypothetical protein